MKRLSSDRSGLLHVAIAFCAVAVLLSPLAARSARVSSSSPGTTVVLPPTMAMPAETPFPKIYVERDPFAAPSYMQTPSQAAQTRAVVRAVASGPRASALVEEDGQTRLVSVGDSVDGSAIVRIDARGIVLGNGARVRLEDLQP